MDQCKDALVHVTDIGDEDALAMVEKVIGRPPWGAQLVGLELLKEASSLGVCQGGLAELVKKREGQLGHRLHLQAVITSKSNPSSLSSH